MRINAYILAADPAWIEASVLSYYDIVEKIVVSYDENSIGYTGVPVAVEECLARLKAIDKDNKLVYCPGHYARLDHIPRDNDTYQRQCALEEAGKDAEWVLQLDTDEVLGDPNTFFSCLEEAHQKGFDSMEYPARWLYQKLGSGLYLEACRRFWGIAANYPGPVAVKSNTTLRHMRQCDNTMFRVDFDVKNTDPAHAKDAPVHRVVKASQAINHFSMIRKEADLRRKTQTYSHAKDLDWSREIRHWVWAKHHPYSAMLKTPFVVRKFFKTRAPFVRVTKIAEPTKYK